MLASESCIITNETSKSSITLDDLLISCHDTAVVAGVCNMLKMTFKLKNVNFML